MQMYNLDLSVVARNETMHKRVDQLWVKVRTTLLAKCCQTDSWLSRLTTLYFVVRFTIRNRVMFKYWRCPDLYVHEKMHKTADQLQTPPSRAEQCWMYKHDRAYSCSASRIICGIYDEVGDQENKLIFTLNTQVTYILSFILGSSIQFCTFLLYPGQCIVFAKRTAR